MRHPLSLDTFQTSGIAHAAGAWTLRKVPRGASAFALTLLASSLLCSPVLAQKPAFQLAPALALEAEDFAIEKGWRVVQNGQGNYMVDIIGFQHISGERLLCVDGADKTAVAVAKGTAPEAGDYRLWVRYEYPPFTECRFRVVVEQAGKTLLNHVAGAKESPRYAFGETKPRAQYDPSWGAEGLVEEAVNVPGVAAGPLSIRLEAVEQPQTPGIAAARNIDLVYLTRDTADAWVAHYQPRANLYPILEAFRDSRGPRYEVQFINRGDKPASFAVNYALNRIPWNASEGVLVKDLAPGATSAWRGLAQQDTAHFGLANFTALGQPFDLAIRAAGAATVEREAKGESSYAFYLPTYPGKGEKIVSPIEELDAVLKLLKDSKPVGRVPTRPLCYGGWLPLGQENEYGRKYAELYAALGMRSLHPAHSGPAVQKNLEAAGVPLTQSWAASGYRNPPTPESIAAAKQALAKNGLAKQLLWFDYGDEIGFSEWIGTMLAGEAAKRKTEGKPVLPPGEILAEKWRAWLAQNRPDAKPEDYWMPAWGPLDPAKLRPNSTAEAAQAKPRLYVDSVLFFEQSAIRHVAEGAALVREAFGQHVRCGANYSCHPFYYPHSTMYIHWFRGRAADMGRHSEYFWQVTQPGPMINGYVAEHFRCGMRNNPHAVLKQYTMPHSPGNTEANFMRSCFTHLAHGAKMLDFFGIGMNETFTENHIDHRDHARYRAIRDVTHAVGLVEDQLPESAVLPSQTALLVSESTERWDLAGIATDQAGHAPFGPNFRKTRLDAHLERLGLWTALTFLGHSPDLMIEEDLKPAILDRYKMLVLVGDCLPPAGAAAIEAWVRRGGVLLATAGAGRFDSYRQPIAQYQQLFGLESRQTDPQTTFFRARQELPFLKPLTMLERGDLQMPVLATHERIKPVEDAEVLSRFADDKSPAWIVRKLGKGQVFYVAALPGVASLWSALQPPAVPDRGPGTHKLPTEYDAGARLLLEHVAKNAELEAPIVATPALVDARLLMARSAYLLPIANYNPQSGQPQKLAIKTPSRVRKVISALHGELPFREEDGRTVIELPRLEYGDMLRLERD